MVKEYNPEGEKGETSLFGGIKVMKDSIRVKAYGTVDELNSVVGVARSHIENGAVNKLLEEIQTNLFIVGSDLATQTGKKEHVPQVSEDMVKFVEEKIVEYNAELVPLANFVLPSGNTGASQLHLARTICRRAERSVVSLADQESLNRKCILYLNRLSDLFFTLARYLNRIDGKQEDIWKA